MRKIFIVGMVIVALGLFGIGIIEATPYIIDGYVDDWGINLDSANSKYDLNTNLPSGGLDIDYETEDNADSNATWTEVGPLWSYYNLFDAEAMYFDNDQYYAYIAIIQGLPEGGEIAPGNPWFLPGDIAIDANYDGIYEYGLDISTFDSTANTASLMDVTSWKDVYYSQASEANPWAIDAGTQAGLVDFVYSGNRNTHYVLEAAIPLGYLELSANPGDPIQPISIHWTQECGNDYLTLNADVNPIPEPATMLLLGTGLIGLAGVGRKKFSKGTQ